MNAVRKIIGKDVESVSIPKQFRGKLVEVIFFPLNDQEAKLISTQNNDIEGSKFYGCMTDFPARDTAEYVCEREPFL